MQPRSVQMPGYRVNEYQLVLNPNDALREKICKVKEAFNDKYHLPLQRQLKSNICIARFSHWEMMEEKILLRLQSIAMGIAPFKIEINNFGSFPTHSIFLNITTRLPVQQLVRSVKTAGTLLKMNSEHKPLFLEEPHIPIAVRLKPWQYEKGWQEYTHRQFTGKFIADSMLLLKRASGDRYAFQILKRFEFLNLPVLTKQGSFFEV
jgi:2'-5' RNA ligase